MPEQVPHGIANGTVLGPGSIRAGPKTSGPFRVSCFARSAHSLFKAAVVASCSIECSAESMQARFASLPDALWKRIEPLLPKRGPRPRGGRPRVADRVVMAGIVYRLRTGCQWKALPREFSSGSTCHSRFERAGSNRLSAAAASLHSLAVSAVGRGAGLSSARTLGTTSSAHDSCGGNERDRGISGWFILRARSSRSSGLDDFPDRAFAVLMELVRIAESSLASRISEAISAPCISSGSARRNHPCERPPSCG